MTCKKVNRSRDHQMIWLKPKLFPLPGAKLKPINQYSINKYPPYQVARTVLSIGLWVVLLLIIFVSQRVSQGHAVEIAPVIQARLLGGQYFFDEQESSLSGNISALFAPGISFNDKWKLIPTLSASWRGTKSVQDLIGGGTLFQQTQDHSLSVKALYSPNKVWQFKAGGGYRLQLLKETADENWGEGLFDFEKPSGNLEVERTLSKDTSIRAGYDYYYINFRNYTSLESQQRNLGRENAGADTLDTFNNGAYLALKTAFPFFKQQKARLDFAYHYTYISFPDQKIVLLTGDLSQDLRKDHSQFVTTNLSLPFIFSNTFKLLNEIHVNYSQLASDQNNFDAGKTRFNSDFYSYKDYGTGSNFNFIVGKKPLIFTSGFKFVRRQYDARPVQDSAGTYLSPKVEINEYYANFGATYPVNKHFRAQALLNFGWSRSNNKFEQTYRYNYRTFTYLLGIIYDY